MLHPHSNIPDVQRGVRVPDPDQKERMAQLEARLAAAKKAQEPAPRKDDHHSQAQVGWRMVTELVAGLMIGATLGYGLDTLAGTLPWGLVVFTMLGFAAGVKTMLRSAQEFQKNNAAPEAEANDARKGGTDERV